jgi:adenine phosphoribosyltransferase
MDYKQYIKDVPNFPIEGILFRDITPLMADGQVFHQACQELTEFAEQLGTEIVVGPESRGFIFGCPIRLQFRSRFAPVRKPKKITTGNR